jgi:hypothetical protein
MHEHGELHSTPLRDSEPEATARPTLLTTRDAAVFCGFRTLGALRKARLEGRVRAAGRRGGRGTLVWAVADLERFMRGLPPLADDAGEP